MSGRRWLLGGGLLVLSLALTGQCADMAKKPSVNYAGPDFTVARNAYNSSLEALQGTRTSALVRLLQVNVENAEVMLKEKTRTRNVTGMAVANNAKSIFEGALTNLSATGVMRIPEKVRRELESGMEEFKTAAQKIEGEFNTARTTLQTNSFDRFKALALQAGFDMKGEAAGETLKHDFQSWLEGKFESVAGAAAESGEGEAKVTESAKPALPAILASSGEAAKWVTVAHWQGVVRGMDVITIPLTQMQVGTNASEKANPIAGVDSHFEYQALFNFPKKSAVPVRLKRVSGKEGAEVLEWPSAGNDFTLSLRLVAPKYPSTHGFDLQVGVAEGGSVALFAGAAMEGAEGKIEDAPPVFLAISTLPAGAAVMVDGALVKDSVSPCRVSLTNGTHTIELMLPGYLPMSLSNESVTANRTVKWKFLPDPRVISKSCSLSADVNQWYPSGIIVQPNSLIAIKADGEWSCGAQGERCSAAGYPASVPTYKHYEDPALRQVAHANYGALLARIAKDGPVIVVGQGTRIKAEGKGMLYFDINEVPGKAARSDNAGELTLRISIIPPEALAR